MENTELQTEISFVKTFQLKEQKSLLRFLTCGSVDDGKSTLIGRLLFETGAIFDNELEGLVKDSKKYGTTGDDIDYALLIDGLSSEREQGITIDVAYRFFATKKRKFIVADTPGHEQYTRNMATGASTCEAAIIMVDARKGILSQTKRHSFIVSLLGIKKIIVAVNKMDLVDFNETVFKKIESDYHSFAKKLDFKEIHTVPVSALKGDNLTKSSLNCQWYGGPSLLTLLETLEVENNIHQKNFRFCVQWVNRPDLNFRGYSGTVNSGSIQVGDKVRILPSGKTSAIKTIVTFDGKLNRASKGQAVTLTLKDEIDISRGDVLCSSENSCEVAENFQTTLIWISDKPLVLSRDYLLKSGTQLVAATVSKLKYGIDVNTMVHKHVDNLKLNEVGVCEINLNKAIPFESYEDNPSLGGFILIDRISNETVGCGFINFALRRSGNIHKQALTVTEKERAAIKGHKPCVIWLTGLSGAGKSTIANILEARLNQRDIHTTLLDGDNIRHGLNKDLGFTEKERAENIRRIAEVAKLMVEAGLITIVSFISPYRAERMMAKRLLGEDKFLEVFIDVPLSVAERRDPKGLYKKARAGEIKNFTGIDSEYQPPLSPMLAIDSSNIEAEMAAEKILILLKDKEIIKQ